MIPYFCQFHRCSRRCVNPATKKCSIFTSTDSVTALPLCLSAVPVSFEPPPLLSMAGGDVLLLQMCFLTFDFPIINAVSCLPLMLMIHLPPLMYQPLMMMAAQILKN
jgi:hypothetical protein